MTAEKVLGKYTKNYWIISAKLIKCLNIAVFVLYQMGIRWKEVDM